MRIVLLGDIHLYRLALWPWHLLSKRLLTQMNLWFNRQAKFQRHLVAELVERVAALEPDLVLCSGDLTMSALHGEFCDAKAALAPLAERFALFAVPGNHDRNTYASVRKRRFEQYMLPYTAERWPHHQVLAEGVHLIGLDATRANALTDVGKVGPQQLDALRTTLEGIDPGDRVIVLCHYTIGVPPGRRPEVPGHALVDERKLVDVLSGPHETLYLHGHVHQPWCYRHVTARNVISLNAGAPLMLHRLYRQGQGFWRIETEADGAGPWRLFRHVRAESGWNAAIEIEAPEQPGDVSDVRPSGEAEIAVNPPDEITSK